MDDIRICGLPEHLELGEDIRRSATATWWFMGDLIGLSKDQIRKAIQDAFNSWTKVANCRGVEASTQQQASLLIAVKQLDGPQGVLADCELPGPAIQHMRVDNAEQWTVQLGSNVPANLIDIERVLRHELGHFWGIGHISRGNLMAPTYSSKIWEPQQGDIEEMVGKYGPPIATPSPSPGMPYEMWIKDEQGIVTSKFRLIRLPD